MATPSAHVGHRWRHRGIRGALVVVWLTWAAHLGTCGDVGYLQGARWGRPRPTRIPMQVRERRSEKRAGLRGKPRGKDAAARMLTSRMKGAKSAEEFVQILNAAVDGHIFNYFHASCAYHQLATWKKSGKLPKAAGSLKLPKLNARVQHMIEEGQLEARALANVLWSFVYLFDESPDVLDLVPAIAAQAPEKAKDMVPQALSNVLWAAAKLKDDAPDALGVVDAIVAQVPDKAKDMKPQELSNVLWAAAKLKDDAPDALGVVDAVVAQVPDKAKDMIPQDLSNVLWAAASLKADAPDVRGVVPAIVAQVPDKAKDMKPQGLSNSLLALVLLQDSVPGVSSFLLGEAGSNTGLVAEAASQVVKLLPKLTGLDLFLTPPSVVWACAKLEQRHDELLSAVAKQFASRKTISSLSDWGLCALYGSYQLLDSTDRFTDFAEMLKKELTRRRLSESDVGWSLEGPLDWAWTEK